MECGASAAAMTAARRPVLSPPPPRPSAARGTKKSANSPFSPFAGTAGMPRSFGICFRACFRGTLLHVLGDSPHLGSPARQRPRSRCCFERPNRDGSGHRRRRAAPAAFQLTTRRMTQRGRERTRAPRSATIYAAIPRPLHKGEGLAALHIYISSAGGERGETVAARVTVCSE